MTGLKHWEDFEAGQVFTYGPLAKADLAAHAATCIARFKLPKRYIFLETLPKSSYGKILK